MLPPDDEGIRPEPRPSVRGATPQGEAKDRLLELHYILERLRDAHTAEGADIWIHGRNRDLGGEKPIDLLGVGQFERVLAAVERLSAGGSSTFRRGQLLSSTTAGGGPVFNRR